MREDFFSEEVWRWRRRRKTPLLFPFAPVSAHVPFFFGSPLSDEEDSPKVEHLLRLKTAIRNGFCF